MKLNRSPKYADIASWYQLHEQYDQAKKANNQTKIDELAKKILNSSYYKDIRRKYGLD